MRLSVLILALTVAACSAPQPKQLYDGPPRKPSEIATVHASSAKGALVLITSVDGKSTQDITWGYLGSVVVLPGPHTFGAEVTIGADAPKTEPSVMAPPPSVMPVPLELAKGSFLVEKSQVSVSGTVEAGREYELRYGYVLEGQGRKKHLLWLEPRRAGTTP